MVKFFNQDEIGIEGIAGTVGNAAKTAVKATTAQADTSANDFMSQLIGDTVVQEGVDPNEDNGIEAAGQGKATAALKAKTNIRNPASAQSHFRKGIGGQASERQREMLEKGYNEEEIRKLDKLRILLHDEQVRDIMEPKKQQPEEHVAEKQAREEEEKKKKKQEKQFVEEKKKEDLAVVQKRTSIENKAWGAG